MLAGFFLFMEDQNTNTDTAQAQTTVDEQVNNTGAEAQQDSGVGTQPTEQQKTVHTEVTQTREKTFTQADIDRIVKDRLSKAVKSELRKLTGETEGQPTVSDLQQQLKDTEQRARTFETKEQIRDFLLDSRNKTAVRPENMRSIEKLVFAEVEFDDSGEITNLKEAIDRVRSEAPSLFVTTTTQINGNTGRNQPGIVDFNEQLRAAAGYRPR